MVAIRPMEAKIGITRHRYGRESDFYFGEERLSRYVRNLNF